MEILAGRVNLRKICEWGYDAEGYYERGHLVCDGLQVDQIAATEEQRSADSQIVKLFNEHCVNCSFYRSR
jgi:hypothetical protein